MPQTQSKKPKDWIVIGIGGVTCGGKTTLANQIHKCIHPSFLLHQDTYFYPDDYPGHTKCEGMDHNNYDIISSLDMQRMYDDVGKIMKGEKTDIQVKASSNPSSQDISYKFPNKNLLIVEGFCLLNYKPIADLCDIKYFITLEFGECLARRVFRIYEPPDVPGYFENFVWPNYLLQKEELESDASVHFLDGLVGGGEHKDYVLDTLRGLGLVTVKPS